MAFGPAYFQSWRNIFDFLLSFPTIGYTIFGFVVLSMPSKTLYLQVSLIIYPISFSTTIHCISDIKLSFINWYSEVTNSNGEICMFSIVYVFSFFI